MLLIQPLGDLRKKLGGNRLVHEQRFHRVADGGTLDLRVQRDFPGHFQIRVGIHKNVADALVMFDDRHLGALGHGANQTFAAAGHAQVNVLRERKQNGNRLAIGHGHHLDGVSGKFRERLFARLNHDSRDGLIRVQRFPAATQNHRVAGFEAQARRVRCHVGT